MKIERKLVPESTLDEFVDRHGLVVEVVERDGHLKYGLPRFYAHLKGVEVKDGIILSSPFSDGDTENAALEGLSGIYSERLLVVDAYRATRREIQCPRLLPWKAGKEVRR